MATLQQNILEKFLSALAEGKDVDPEQIEQLRKLLADGKKPKADDLVRIFTTPVGGEVK